MKTRTPAEKRSYNMSQIKSGDTKPEIIVRKHLFHCGFRYRLHVRDLPGTPDIVLSKYRTVILVHGCFWHMHGCRYFKWPQNNADFWRQKITATAERDQRQKEDLKQLGWNVIVIWECDLKDRRIDTLNDLVRDFHSQRKPQSD